MSDADFKRRVEMIEAGSAGDFQTVNDLLKDDKYFWSFGPYLRAQSYLSLEAVEKSLSLPNVNRSSGYFDRMISGLVQSAAYNNQKEFLEVLLEHAPAPAAAAQEGLAHIFNTLSEPAGEEHSPEIAAVLVRHGADVGKASQSIEMYLASQQRVAAASLAKLAAFKRGIAT